MASPDVSKRPHDIHGFVAAIGFICLGIFLIAQSQAMTAMGSVFPVAVSAAMIVVAAILVVRNVVIGLRRKPAEPEEAGAGAAPQKPVTLEESTTAGGSNIRRLAFLAIMAAWIVLIPVLGFFVASLVAYFAIMAVSLHERVGMREGIAMVVISIVILVGFYLLMANVLLLPLPRGLFF